MPGTTAGQDIELIVEKVADDGGGILPPSNGGGGGDEGKRPPKRRPSPRRYYTGIALGIVSVLMFFMALASAYLVRRGSPDWVPVRVPGLMWFNTAVLLVSSGTLEMARKRLGLLDVLQAVVGGDHDPRCGFPDWAGGGVEAVGWRRNLSGE